MSCPSSYALTRKFQVLRVNLLRLEMAPEPSRLNLRLFSIMKIHLLGDLHLGLSMPRNRFAAVSSDAVVLAGASRPDHDMFVVIIILTSP